ncbi:MAG TPA: hypothetical protein VGD64_02365 [Acidisarcina sp.]
MENAKDTFYLTLRNQLSIVNPARAVLLRGVERPGIYVEEAEGVMALIPPDVFVLRWTGLKVNVNSPLPLAQMDCEIHYTTSGSGAFGGLDRGRAMSALDAELTTILIPASAPKFNYKLTPPVAINTNIFWTEPTFAPIESTRDRLTRVATVTLFSYEGQGNQ